ncbi:putative reverse transcriptase domain-containing protein [Tanacetum coccineum]
MPAGKHTVASGNKLSLLSNSPPIKPLKGNGTAPKGNGCFECGATGHFKRDYPKLKNRDGGNGNAQGWVYAVRKCRKERKCIGKHLMPMSSRMSLDNGRVEIERIAGDSYLVFISSRVHGQRMPGLIWLRPVDIPNHLIPGRTRFSSSTVYRLAPSEIEGIIRTITRAFSDKWIHQA